VTRNGDEIEIAAAARSFLHHQVRSMVGCLALVGRGQWTPDDMRKALKAKDHPTVVFRAEAYDLARSSDSVAVTMTGNLTLGGVEKPITIKAHAKPGPNGTLVVSGTREVRMTEFGLKPPTLMLGTMKVDERVTVGFDVVLKN